MMLQRFFLTFALLVASVAAQAQTFPPLTGRVVDTANILDPTQEQALTAKLKAIEDQSGRQVVVATLADLQGRSEEHTSELQSLMRISYAVFCLKKKHIYPPHHIPTLN